MEDFSQNFWKGLQSSHLGQETDFGNIWNPVLGAFVCPHALRLVFTCLILCADESRRHSDADYARVNSLRSSVYCLSQHYHLCRDYRPDCAAFSLWCHLSPDIFIIIIMMMMIKSVCIMAHHILLPKVLCLFSIGSHAVSTGRNVFQAHGVSSNIQKQHACSAQTLHFYYNSAL